MAKGGKKKLCAVKSAVKVPCGVTSPLPLLFRCLSYSCTAIYDCWILGDHKMSDAPEYYIEFGRLLYYKGTAFHTNTVLCDQIASSAEGITTLLCYCLSNLDLDGVSTMRKLFFDFFPEQSIVDNVRGCEGVCHYCSFESFQCILCGIAIDWKSGQSGWVLDMLTVHEQLSVVSFTAAMLIELFDRQVIELCYNDGLVHTKLVRPLHKGLVAAHFVGSEHTDMYCDKNILESDTVCDTNCTTKKLKCGVLYGTVLQTVYVTKFSSLRFLCAGAHLCQPGIRVANNSEQVYDAPLRSYCPEVCASIMVREDEIAVLSEEYTAISNDRKDLVGRAVAYALANNLRRYEHIIVKLVDIETDILELESAMQKLASERTILVNYANQLSLLHNLN